jgi:hypothetical protein
MIRFQKWLAIFLYILAMLVIIPEVGCIIKGYYSADEIVLVIFIVVPSFFGRLLYKKYKLRLKKYRDLLKECNEEKIDYSIKGGGGYNQPDYVLTFYINGELCCEGIDRFLCRGTKNNEYYLKPLYNTNGEFKDFRVYMDKNNAREKRLNYRIERQKYDKQRSKQETEKVNVEESSQTQKVAKLKKEPNEFKKPAIPKTNSKRMKKKYGMKEK